LSSILRALKKLENDPRHLEETQPLDSKFIPLADTTSQKKLPNVFMVAIGGGIVCGLVLLAGWWLLSDKTHTPPVPQQKISQQNLRQQEALPVMVQETKNIQRSALTVEPPPPSIDTAVSEKTRLPDSEPIPVVINETTTPVIEKEKIVPVVEAVPQEAAAEAPLTQSPETSKQRPILEETDIVSTRSPEVPIKAKEIEIPLLRDPEMKLQAITWSKDPQKRIIVINNRIMRQGETVRGYRIETINQDDIILGENGEKWKFLFRIK